MSERRMPLIGRFSKPCQVLSEGTKIMALFGSKGERPTGVFSSA
jgi:hypothetical protein